MEDQKEQFGTIKSIPSEIRRIYEQDTKVYSNAEEYEKAYTIHRQHWGISSPVFVLYPNFFPQHPYPGVLPKEVKGGVFVGINGSNIPDNDYLKYLKTHEYWEHYIRTKRGFNLLKSDEEDYHIPILDRKRPSHRYATLLELHEAQKDNKLEEYMKWWREFYQNDIDYISSQPEEEIRQFSAHYGVPVNENPRDYIIKLIKNNRQLKEEIYQKVKGD